MGEQSPRSHLDVDEHAVVGLVQSLVVLGAQGELKGDLRLASRDLASFCHLDVGVDQLNGLLRSTLEVTTTSTLKTSFTDVPLILFE